MQSHRILFIRRVNEYSEGCDEAVPSPVIARSNATKQSMPSAQKLDCFASLAMTLEESSRPRANCKILPAVPMARLCKLPIYSGTITTTERGDDKTSIAAWRVHAAGQYPHRCVALSRRMAGRQFQFRASKTSDPEIGERKIRRFLHGRPSGRA